MRQLGQVFEKPFKNKVTYHIAGVSRVTKNLTYADGAEYQVIDYQVNYLDDYGLLALKRFRVGIVGRFTNRHERKIEREAVAFRLDFVDRMRRQAARGARAAAKR